MTGGATKCRPFPEFSHRQHPAVDDLVPIPVGPRPRVAGLWVGDGGEVGPEAVPEHSGLDGPAVGLGQRMVEPVVADRDRVGGLGGVEEVRGVPVRKRRYRPQLLHAHTWERERARDAQPPEQSEPTPATSWATACRRAGCNRPGHGRASREPHERGPGGPAGVGAVAVPVQEPQGVQPVHRGGSHPEHLPGPGDVVAERRGGEKAVASALDRLEHATGDGVRSGVPADCFQLFRGKPKPRVRGQLQGGRGQMMCAEPSNHTPERSAEKEQI